MCQFDQGRVSCTSKGLPVWGVWTFFLGETFLLETFLCCGMAWAALITAVQNCLSSAQGVATQASRACLISPLYYISIQQRIPHCCSADLHSHALPPECSPALWGSCCGLSSLARAQGEASKAAHLSVGHSREGDIISTVLAVTDTLDP